MKALPPCPFIATLPPSFSIPSPPFASASRASHTTLPTAVTLEKMFRIPRIAAISFRLDCSIVPTGSTVRPFDRSSSRFLEISYLPLAIRKLLCRFDRDKNQERVRLYFHALPPSASFEACETSLGTVEARQKAKSGSFIGRGRKREIKKERRERSGWIGGWQRML